MRFEHPDYPGTFSVRIVEVHYEKDEPYAWSEPSFVIVEDLDVPQDATEDDIKKEYAIQSLQVQSMVTNALTKPILYERDFSED